MNSEIFISSCRSPELERELNARHELDLDEILPIVGPLLGAGVLGFSLWDYWIDPVHAQISTLARAVCVLLAAVAFRPGRIGWTVTQRAGFIHWMYLLAVIAATCILDDGFAVGIAGVIVGCFLIPIVTIRVSTFLWIALPPFFVFVALAWRYGSSFELINGILFYALALSVALLLMLLVRYLRCKAFVLERQLADLAQHDPLTGLNNRARITEIAEREMKLAQRRGRSFAVAMLDVDHFKRVNDTYGHAVGDAVLRTLASICKGSLREVDHVGRIGGEEFVCILPEANVSEALACAERLRSVVEGSCIESLAGPIRITISIGVALFPEAGSTWEEVLRAADNAMYDAKRQGRNRVALALPVPGVPIPMKNVEVTLHGTGDPGDPGAVPMRPRA